MTPPAGDTHHHQRKSIHGKIEDGVPHSSYKDKSVDCGDLKERLMVDIFSKIRQEQIDDKQKRVVGSANAVGAKKASNRRTNGGTKTDVSEIAHKESRSVNE